MHSVNYDWQTEAIEQLQDPRRLSMRRLSIRLQRRASSREGVLQALPSGLGNIRSIPDSRNVTSRGSNISNDQAKIGSNAEDINFNQGLRNIKSTSQLIIESREEDNVARAQTATHASKLKKMPQKRTSYLAISTGNEVINSEKNSLT